MYGDDRAAALATFLVSEIERVHPARPIGRSLLQKLTYILARNGHVDICFELTINGPYSDNVENALGHAVESGMLTVSKEEGRSSISARGGVPGHIPPELREHIIQCVRAYSFYEEADLAILATSLFLEHHRFRDPDGLIKAVIDVNPRFDLRRVCSLLDRSDVVFRSW